MWCPQIPALDGDLPTPCHWAGLEPTPDLGLGENSQVGLVISGPQSTNHSLLSLGNWGKLTLRQPVAQGEPAADLPGLPETGPAAVSGGPRPLPLAHQPKAGGLPGGATRARELIGCPGAGSPQPALDCKLPLVSYTWQRGSQLPAPHPPILTKRAQ